MTPEQIAIQREKGRLRAARWRAMFPEEARQRRREEMRRWRENSTEYQARRREREARRQLRVADPVKYAREYARAHQRKRNGFPVPTRQCPDVCELCGNPQKHKRGKVLALDHDHETGAFRGWLCDPCNTALGRLGDTVASLERALAYLRGDHVKRS